MGEDERAGPDLLTRWPHGGHGQGARHDLRDPQHRRRRAYRRRPARSLLNRSFISHMNESIVEDAALTWLQSIGWLVMHGPELGPDPVDAELNDYGQVVLEERLREALMRLNTL